VANALVACKTAGDVARSEDVARRFVERRRGTRCFSLTRQETRVLDAVEAAAALVDGRGLAPGDPLDSAFWAEANRLADACWEGDVKTRGVEHVLADEALDRRGPAVYISS
jgi:hypothetical protein